MVPGCDRQPQQYDDGRHPSSPSILSVRNAWAGGLADAVPQREKTIMDKWTIFTNSKTVRIAASASTVVAVATIAGAGWKWY